MVEEVYVKCWYSPSLISKKYFVKFNGSKNSYPPEGEVMVYESVLARLNEDSGLVRATLIEDRGNKKVVVIKDNEQGGVFSHVPSEDVVLKEEIDKLLFKEKED